MFVVFRVMESFLDGLEFPNDGEVVSMSLMLRMNKLLYGELTRIRRERDRAPHEHKV